MTDFIHKKNRFTSFQIIIGGFIAVILNRSVAFNATGIVKSRDNNPV